MATIRYATYGSVAYNLNRSAEAYADAPVIERPAVKERTRTRVKVRPAARKRSLGKIMTAIGAVVAVGLIVLNLLSYAMLVEISEASSEVEARYTELQEEKAKLLVDYEKTFDMKEIENYAINVMGMMRPGADQTVELDSVRTDKAVVHTVQEESDSNFFTDISNFVAALLSYFK